MLNNFGEKKYVLYFNNLWNQYVHLIYFLRAFM